MQRLEGKRKWFLCAAALAMVLCVSRLHADRRQQTNSMPTPPLLQGSSPAIGSAHDLDPGLARQQELRARMAEDDRHKRMVSDADKLLELATELKTDVDKSTKNETSVSALRKAEEIERLAHDVKERLKN